MARAVTASGMLGGVESLVWTADVPELRSPIMVTAFEGLFNLGHAATGAVEALRRHRTLPLGYIDPENYFDFSQRRPTVQFDDDGNRTIAWPNSRIDALLMDDAERDLVILEGVEPHMMWRTFTEAVVETARRLEVAMVVTLGSMSQNIPHSRPPPVKCSTSDSELAEALMLEGPTYEGPTGVIGVILHQLHSQGIPAVSLRVGVPHYVGGGPNPLASRALLERFERVTGLATPWAELDGPAREWEARVDEAMDDDSEVAGYVRYLENRYDERAEQFDADDLAAEFERFLRRHDNTA